MLNICVRGCNEGIDTVLRNICVQALHEGPGSRMQVADYDVALPPPNQADGVAVDSLKDKGHLFSHAEGSGSDVDFGEVDLWDSDA